MHFSQNRKIRILIISSANPCKGPGVLAQDLQNNLIEHGHDCDILTKEEVKGHSGILYIYKHRGKVMSSLLSKIHLIKKFLFCGIISNKAPYYFFYKSEQHPPISITKVLSRISKPYDLVYIYFWQGMLSFKTVEAIYDKLHCQIHFAGVDYSQMSGGCHFTIDCNRYKSRCGKCPAWRSTKENDFTRRNVEYRAAVYKKVHPIVWGNSYEQSFYRQSSLLKDYDRIESIQATIDESMFKPMDTFSLRTKYSINARKKFIILFGSQSIEDPRKGFNYLCEALHIFSNRLSNEFQEEILLITIGETKAITSNLPFDTYPLGYVPYARLPEIYSLADLFICPSVYDAGPMMVNQAIMCGTPVVGFEIGALLDLVKDKGTGLCAEYKNAQSLCDCIERMYLLFRTHKSTYSDIRLKCREVGLKNLSRDNQIKKILSAYYKYL